MTGLTLALCILVFIVPLAAFLITQDWSEPDPRSITKQVADFIVLAVGLVVIYVGLNLTFHGTALGKWQGGGFAIAYASGSLVRIAVVASLRRRADAVPE